MYLLKMYSGLIDIQLVCSDTDVKMVQMLKEPPVSW